MVLCDWLKTLGLVLLVCVALRAVSAEQLQGGLNTTAANRTNDEERVASGSLETALEKIKTKLTQLHFGSNVKPDSPAILDIDAWRAIANIEKEFPNEAVEPLRVILKEHYKDDDVLENALADAQKADGGNTIVAKLQAAHRDYIEKAAIKEFNKLGLHEMETQELFESPDFHKWVDVALSSLKDKEEKWKFVYEVIRKKKSDRSILKYLIEKPGATRADIAHEVQQQIFKSSKKRHRRGSRRFYYYLVSIMENDSSYKKAYADKWWSYMKPSGEVYEGIRDNFGTEEAERLWEEVSLASTRAKKTRAKKAENKRAEMMKAVTNANAQSLSEAMGSKRKAIDQLQRQKRESEQDSSSSKRPKRLSSTEPN